MSVTEAVIERVQALSPEQQQKVLEFVEKIEQQASTRKSIAEIAEECFKNVPPEDWAQVPSDASLNVDHYLYGAPKK